MAANEIQKFSPRWLGDLIRKGLDLFYDGLADRLERTKWVHVFNLLVFCGFAVLIFSLRKISIYFDIDLTQARNLLTSRYSESYGAILAIAAFGTMAFYLRAESLPQFGTLGFGLGICALYFFPGNRFVPSPVSLTVNLLISFGIYLSFYYLRSRISARILKWDFYLAGYIALFASYFIEYYFYMDVMWYFEITRLMFVFSLLSLEYQARRNPSPAAEAAYIFSAMNVLTPIPVEVKDRTYTDKWRLRIRGLFDILFGIIFLAIAIKVKMKFLEFPDELTFASIFTYGLTNYFYYFLGSYAWMSLPVGIGRWYGMNLPDAFDLPLLSSSPADRWRRWNTFYYNWFYKVVFFPIFKTTRSLALSLLAVSFATVVVHSGNLSYGIFLGETPQLLTRTFILLVLLFSLHGVLLYISIKFPRLFPSENSRWGWLGVAIVTCLMALIHVIAPK